MTKSLTKVWLGGMKRMLSPAAKRSARDAQRITRDALEAAASAAVSDLSPPRESRVRPRGRMGGRRVTRGEHPMAPRSGASSRISRTAFTCRLAAGVARCRSW